MLIAIGAAVLALTILAVVIQSARIHAVHGEARSLSEPVDIAIVLSSGLDPDRVPTYLTRRRVGMGVYLLDEGKTKRLLMTGTTNPGLTPTVADMMLKQAVEYGAPAKAILVETEARSTLDNLRFAHAMAMAEGAGRVAIITDNFHMARTLWLARYLELEGVEPVSVDSIRYISTHSTLWWYTREALAWWLNLGKIGALEVLRLAGVSEERRRQLIR